MLKIYLDNCCYGRIFDDLTQTKIYLESKAVESILLLYEKRELVIYTSQAAVFEFSNITDLSKKRQIEDLYNALSLKNIEYGDLIKDRAAELRNYNIKDMDSLHIAFAERAEADYFITTDKFLLNVAKRVILKTKIISPIDFIMEMEV